MESELAVQGATVIGAAVGFCIGLVVQAIIGAVVAFLLIESYKVLPADHQKIEPGKIWFLAIPIFNVYWNFQTWPKVAESYQSYFASVGGGGDGDCGRQMAMIYSGLVAVGFVISLAGIVLPVVGYIGCLTGPAALVLLILLLMKFFGYKKALAPAA